MDRIRNPACTVPTYRHLGTGTYLLEKELCVGCPPSNSSFAWPLPLQYFRQAQEVQDPRHEVRPSLGESFAFFFLCFTDAVGNDVTKCVV